MRALIVQKLVTKIVVDESVAPAWEHTFAA